MKTNTLFTKFYILFFMVFISLVSCNSDNADPIDEPITDPNPKSETAIVATLRVQTPGGRIIYMGVYSEIPEELDFKNMIEIGSSATVTSYGENPYVWKGNSSTLIKYEVTNNLEINVSGVLSFASTGLSGTFNIPSFVSPTKAYFFALPEGKIIEFNPTTMEITETITVDVLEHSGDAEINTYTYANIVTSEGKVILPIGAYTKNPNRFPQYAQLAVFDPVLKSLSYVKDTRMSMGYGTYTKGNDGAFYYRPAKHTVIAEDYTTLTDYPTTGGLLKINDNGTFDPDFFVDLKGILNAHSANSVVSIYDGKAIVQYSDASFIPPANPSDWYGSHSQKFALVDINEKTFEAFTSFNKYGTVWTIGRIDGVEYFANYGASSGKYHLLKQTGATDFTEASEGIGGALSYIGRLR